MQKTARSGNWLSALCGVFGGCCVSCSVSLSFCLSFAPCRLHQIFQDNFLCRLSSSLVDCFLVVVVVVVAFNDQVPQIKGTRV
ncbi:hypothetical protein B0T17DRAFT_125587 [Bombardia bombarda]|uniref:Uncharacterized protein n=1 Tax=Bombardia bombarda TaxID=252184 RepID=A0AA39TGK5_9PEZI|nr:hypothetical protein B0T17DRAFT_125587 [Bombardia bombarda]